MKVRLGCVPEWSVKVGAFAVLFVSNSSTWAQQGIYSDRPPAAFKTAFDDAVGPAGARRDRGLARLASEVDWEPYFRTALNALARQDMRDQLRPALEKCRARLIDWNLERAKTWATELRFDYLSSLGAQLDDPVKAIRVGELVFKAQKNVCDQFRKVANFRAQSFLVHADFATFMKKKEFRQLSGDLVTISKKQDDPPPSTFLHSRTLEVEPHAYHSCLALVRDSITTRREPDVPSWGYSVLVVNAGCRLASLSNALLVCDGDLDFSNPVGGCSHCLVICNGTITAPPEYFSLGDSAVLYATGDFLGYKKGGLRKTASIVTGGKNDSALPKDAPNAEWFREGVKEIPFGIKFVTPADTGVELRIGKGVVYVGKLTETSPLFKHSFESGDWIKSLNGVSILTAADFRRQLRESLLWGTGLFEIKRGDQTFLRLVKFAEPPKAAPK